MTIKQQLKEIKKEKGLRAYVAGEILDSLSGYDGTAKEQAQSWLEDLMRGGCQSGFIGGLIYYKDTHKFFDKYYDEIEGLRYDSIQEIGDCNWLTSSDLKNQLAWFGFEETSRKIGDELGLEV